MKTYYCEVKGKFEPHFEGYKLEAATDEEAIALFQKRWDSRLELVYYEKGDDMEIIYEL